MGAGLQRPEEGLWGFRDAWLPLSCRSQTLREVGGVPSVCRCPALLPWNVSPNPHPTQT